MITNDTSKVIYNGDGSTAIFPYTFKIFADGDLIVVLQDANGVETVQTLNSDYTVTGAGNDSGGNVIFVTAPASGYKVIIYRSISLTQPVDYVPNDPFPAETHEEALDRLTMITQQLQEQLDRALLRDLSQSSGLTLPVLAAGKYLYTDGSTLQWVTPSTINIDYDGNISRGLDANKPASPGVGDVYIATDTLKIYICKVAGSWSEHKTDGSTFENLANIPPGAGNIPGANLGGNQTIAGVKTFTSIPVLPASDPTADNEAARKAYVDAATTPDNVTIERSTGQLKVKDSGISQAKLKTAVGEVSISGGAWVHLTLPGGEYGFYPQLKNENNNVNFTAKILAGENLNLPQITSYTAKITLWTNSGAGYAQQRYVTSSGEDLWIFLLVDKITKEIIAAYQAPDHPAYGNGGDFNKLSHPFDNYDPSKHEIILVDKETVAELKAQVTPEKSLLTLVNEEYKPNMDKEEVYQPLHSGRFIDKEPELVQAIPNYIKVRKLLKLTPQEKQERENKKQLAIQKAEQDRVKKEQNKISAINKLKALGLTREEIEAL